MKLSSTYHVNLADCVETSDGYVHPDVKWVA